MPTFRGGGGKKHPKMYYVVCDRSLLCVGQCHNISQSKYVKITNFLFLSVFGTSKMLRVNSENNFALNKEIVITLHPTLKSDLESVRKNAILGQFIWT